MNTHMISGHHLDWHWMDKLSSAVHSPKLWIALGIFTLLAAMYVLAFYASMGEGQGPMPYDYGYPSYPSYPIVP